MGNFQRFPLFTYLRSEQNARHFLKMVYTKRAETNVEQKSYKHTANFMYACMHGVELFESGRKAPLLTQPLLFFYGCAHLIKALLYLVDPTYPSSTAQLAHGISTRKKKKKQYAFSRDEVRVQRDGLLPLAAKHIFHLPIPAHTTFSMHQLLVLIPEMQELFTYEGHRYLDHVGSSEERILYFPDALLEKHHLSIDGLLRKMEHHIPNVTQIDKQENITAVHIDRPITHGPHPFFIEQATNKLFFPNRHALFQLIDELLIYYIILYNLSMISRYEIEWWGDTLTTKSTADFPLIEHFLHIVIDKLPAIVHTHLTRLIDPY